MPPRLARFLRLALFSLVTVAFALLVVLPIGIGFLYSHHLVNRACNNVATPLDERLNYPAGMEEFTFSPKNQPDIVLDAWFVPGNNGAGIILAPGAWGGHNTMNAEVEFLQEAGYSLLTYDTRSCANPPQKTTLGYAEIADLQVAIDYMSQRPEVDPNRIGVFGHSMGGATAIMGAARDERIKAVVATGNYADLAEDVRRERDGQPNWIERWMRGWIERNFEWQAGINLEDACPLCDIGKISPRPVFLVHGSLELDQTRGLEQFAAAGDPKDLWIVEGAGHGGYANADFEGYKTRIVAFFDRYLLND